MADGPKWQLMRYRNTYGLHKKIKCTKEENEQFIKMEELGQPLPDGVYKYEGYDGYYRLELSEKEINEYFAFKQLEYLKAIKNYMFFFVVITILSLAILVFMQFL